MSGEWDTSNPDWPSFTGKTPDGYSYTINCYWLVPHAIYEPFVIGSGESPKIRSTVMDWVTGNIENIPHGNQFKPLKHYWGSENLATRVKFT